MDVFGQFVHLLALEFLFIYFIFSSLLSKDPPSPIHPSRPARSKIKTPRQKLPRPPNKQKKKQDNAPSLYIWALGYKINKKWCCVLQNSTPIKHIMFLPRDILVLDVCPKKFGLLVVLLAHTNGKRPQSGLVLLPPSALVVKFCRT